MEPLICPQCGGKIIDYLPGQSLVTCGYCATKFLIEDQKKVSHAVPEPINDPVETTNITPMVIGVTIAIVLFITVAGIFVSSVPRERVTSKPATVSATPAPFPSATGTVSPPNTGQVLLEFGGKGTGNGLFQNAHNIAVDSNGKIYVGDESLRVQQFDEKGEFIKVWQIPSKGAVYDHARAITKIVPGNDGRLYVLIGGVILVYNAESTSPVKTIHFAPAFIQDMVIRSDGVMLTLSNDSEAETLSFLNKSGGVTRRLRSFHSDAADAALSPREVGLDAIRFAVDGAGNIFSVYAFGALGSYSLNYNDDELLIFRFTKEGKYVNKFVQSMKSCGIEVDNQSRIYVSDDNSIQVSTNPVQYAHFVPVPRARASFSPC